MRWTRRRRETNVIVADGKGVWSWHPTLVSSWRNDVFANDGGKKARSPGRARYKP
jgi:outer membrane lipoprotein-sorting protein